MTSAYVLLGLAGLFGVIGTILTIILIVKVFQNAGVGLGILAIFCGPFAYIWGWIKSRELKLTKLMVFLTLTYLIAGILYGVGSVQLLNSPEFQKQAEEFRATMEKATQEANEALEKAEVVPTPPAE